MEGKGYKGKEGKTIFGDLFCNGVTGKSGGKRFKEQKGRKVCDMEKYEDEGLNVNN